MLAPESQTGKKLMGEGADSHEGRTKNQARWQCVISKQTIVVAQLDVCINLYLSALCVV